MTGDKIVPSLFCVDFSDLHLPMLTIYDHPIDYPEKFVIRVFDTGRPTNVVMLCDALDAARRAIRSTPWSVLFPRDPADDAKIVETYI